MSENFELSRPMSQAKLLKLAFMLSIVTFVAVAEVVVRTTPVPSEGAEAVKFLGPILVIFYAVLLVGAPFLVRRIRAKQGEDNEQKLTGRVVLQLAIYESGAIYGLVLSFLSHNKYWAHGFGAVAIAMIFLMVKTEPGAA